jgi:alcohol dehydrogenase class IV
LFKERKTPHALGVALFYKAWLRNIVLVNEGYEKMNSLAKRLGISNVSNLIEFFYKFIDSIGILNLFDKTSISERQVESIINNVDGNLKVDPSYRGKEVLYNIVYESFNNPMEGRI